MPSAASTVKLDKQIADNSIGDSSTPIKQAVTMIEHKIRNLEKRKSKLESYKELQNAGKTLNDDQKTAVAKFNEVIHTLDFARDINKQLALIVSMTEKEAKKLAKREQALKNQAELARLREILLVQDALNQMGNDNVREDFLHGRNGAAQLSESDLKLLDDLYPAVTPKHEAGNPTAFTNEVQTAAEHLLAVVDGKPKEVFGGTYCQVKEILGKIHESGYFDQTQVFETFDAEIEQPPIDQLEPIVQDAGSNVECPPEITHQLPIESLSMDPMQAPIHPVVQQIQPLEQQLPVPIPEQIVSPENLYFQQQAAQINQQTPRPISEMLGTGSFFFLQESEIDPQPEQIPTQTFTNQSFVAGIHPQPPMPIPQHFQPPLPNNLPPNVNTLNNIPPTIPNQQQNLNTIQNNGNMLVEEPTFVDESHKVNVNHNNGNKYPPRNQSYYQNNGYKDNYNNKEFKDNYTKDFKDNYNNRPRQNRNGNGRPQNRH